MNEVLSDFQKSKLQELATKADLKAEVTLLKWMVGSVFALLIPIFLKIFS